MKQEPDKLPGELFFDGHGCGLRLLGLFVGLTNPIIAIVSIVSHGAPPWIDSLRHEPLFTSFFFFGPAILLFFLTFTVHQVRINVPART